MSRFIFFRIPFVVYKYITDKNHVFCIVVCKFIRIKYVSMYFIEKSFKLMIWRKAALNSNNENFINNNNEISTNVLILKEML